MPNTLIYHAIYGMIPIKDNRWGDTMQREDEWNEFKKTTGELNEAMVSIAAMLNKHQKGKVYFGLKNDGTPFPFTINDSTLRDVSRKIFEAIRPQIVPEIKIEKISSVEVITVDFKGEDLPYSAFGRYYIRTADEDRELSPAELRRIMIGQEYRENWENKTSEQTIEDVDDKTLKDFYHSAVSCGRMPDIGFDKRILLEQLGVLDGNRLTNAGVCLFSSRHPITLKLAVFATEHKTTFLDIARKDGNIFDLIEAAVSYIIKNMRWRVKMNDDGIHRVEIPEVPVEAIREAVINSFAHARYDIPVQHEIDIFSNRISISNPGSFANDFKPTDYAVRDIRSYLRNEVIANALYRCKDVESFGSGIRKIYALCGAEHVNVSYVNEETAFTMEFSRQDRNDITQDGEINGKINGEINDKMQNGISDAEIDLLTIVKEHMHATMPELAVMAGKSSRTISRLMASLKRKGLVERVGSNKNGYWKIK